MHAALCLLRDEHAALSALLRTVMLMLAQSRASGRVRSEYLELCGGAGGDDLAGCVDVGCFQPELVEMREHFSGVATEQRGHPRRLYGGGRCHRAPAFTNEGERGFL